jgi:hypothetical protein
VIIIDYSTVTFQIVASLTDKSRGIIYHCNAFIVQAAALILYSGNRGRGSYRGGESILLVICNISFTIEWTEALQ